MRVDTKTEIAQGLDRRIRGALLMLLIMVNTAMFVGIMNYARPILTAILDVLSPFLVSAIVAYVFNPVVLAIEKRFGLSRLTGVIIAYVIIVLITAGFLAVLLPVLYFQLKLLASSAIEGINGIREHGLKLGETTLKKEDFDQILANVQQRLDLSKAGTVAGRVAAQVVDTGKLVTDIVAGVASATVGFIAFSSFVVVIAFYFLNDYGYLPPFLNTLLGKKRAVRFFELWTKMDRALGGFLRGQLTVSLIVGILFSLGLMLIGMKPYAILIGFLAGIGNMIPYIGPLMGAIPALAWVAFGAHFPGLSDKCVGAGLVLGLVVFVQTLDGFVLQPKIVGKGAELHPLVVMLALIVGSQFGLGGMVLAVPVAIVVRVCIMELWWVPLLRVREAEADSASDGVGVSTV